MMKDRILWMISAALCASLVVAGCKEDKDDDTDTDTSVDTVTDTAGDTSVDTAMDTVTDVPVDTATDVETDVETDMESDVETDVETDMESDVETDMEADVETDAVTDVVDEDGGVTAYSHTITIDGTNDFVTSDERFATSSTGYWSWVSWDADYLYLGVQGSDINADSSQHWVVIYLGGASGTTTGVNYNTQQPGLSFDALWHVAWRTSNDFTVAYQWGGSSWDDQSWDFTDDVFQSGNFMEMRIPLADIGSPTTLNVTLYMLNESGGSEWSYSAVPSSAFTDGYDPDVAHHLSFDLTAADAPAAYSPI